MSETSDDIEILSVRTYGGPWPGTRILDNGLLKLPLPEVLPDPEGRGDYPFLR